MHNNPQKLTQMQHHLQYLVALFPCLACMPPNSDCTDLDCAVTETSDTHTDDLTETGVNADGDSGDGDGDACQSAATVECDSLNRCWAQAPGWTTSAQWADPIDIQAGVNAGTLIPVALGLNAECYAIEGFDHHFCVVNTECTPLLGQPLTEIELVASACAGAGPWSWVGESTAAPFGICWGLIGDIVVQLGSSTGRRGLVDIQCDEAGCSGLWVGSALRSYVVPAADIIDLSKVDPAVLWDCVPAPDIDVCVKVDANEHVGCFRIYGDYAVAVAPVCSDQGLGWVDIGNDMLAKTI